MAKRRCWSRIPIIILSARDREAEKMAALNLGADDYVANPFGFGELTARIRAALRHRAECEIGLRAKIERNPADLQIIRTEPGVGYRFIGDVK